jgi:Cu+-exporting ATPase
MAMEVDPVCGMRIDSEEAAGMMDYGGKRYYFCSQTCHDAFEADPIAYVK